MKSFVAVSLLMFSVSLLSAPAPLVTVPQQAAFWENISQHCGKAYEGQVVKDSEGETFAGKKLVMFVRKCSEQEIQIPFYIGDDASRTWILTNTGSGIMLKHDHRNKDGSYHTSTMYGGHTEDAGWPQMQSFPADAYSKALFIQQGIPASVDNTWQMMIYPDTFSYRLIRLARDFQVDFDLSHAITPPDAPWGYENQ